MDKNPSFSLVGLCLTVSLVACRPVMTIGWQELAIVVVIALIVLGPVMIRIYRALSRLREGDDRDT